LSVLKFIFQFALKSIISLQSYISVLKYHHKSEGSHANSTNHKFRSFSTWLLFHLDLWCTVYHTTSYVYRLYRLCTCFCTFRILISSTIRSQLFWRSRGQQQEIY